MKWEKRNVRRRRVIAEDFGGAEEAEPDRAKPSPAIHFDCQRVLSDSVVRPL